jgi:hypothetical protein
LFWHKSKQHVIANYEAGSNPEKTQSTGLDCVERSDEAMTLLNLIAALLAMTNTKKKKPR